MCSAKKVTASGLIICFGIPIIICLGLLPGYINSCNHARDNPCYYQKSLCLIEESHIISQYKNCSRNYSSSIWFIKIELNDNSCRENIRGTIQDEKKCVRENNETAMERLNQYKVNREYECYFEQKYCSDDDSKQNITWVNPDNEQCYSLNSISEECSFGILTILPSVCGLVLIPSLLYLIYRCVIDCHNKKVKDVSPPPYDENP
uniref:Uncharacterized protein n=1 Tax=Pithovirus LCPAC403 TaxID=2506596 RepID=A0A481ZCZ9_9VIRU|nr:MAG: hypothetical protein LCPAC403_00730 [Pithovirus LCPAC403]